jgi:hypothetical protein
MTGESGVRISSHRNMRRAFLAMALTIAAFILPTAAAAPASAAQTLAAFTTWVNANENACVGGAANCALLVNVYGNWAGASTVSGNAYQFYANAGAGWQKWGLGAHVPARADVAVYNSGLSGNANGHVAIILENVSASQFRVFHQNWPQGSCATKGYLTRVPATMQGYIRPPVS